MRFSKGSNQYHQASDGPSALSGPWCDNSPEVSLETRDPIVCDPYNVWPRGAGGLVIFVGSGLTDL
jgi:hypothetical protein